MKAYGETNKNRKKYFIVIFEMSLRMDASSYCSIGELLQNLITYFLNMPLEFQIFAIKIFS